MHNCVRKSDFEEIPKGSLVYFNESTFLNILLEEIHKDMPLKDTKVIILDEIHEYSVEVEAIFGLLLKYVRPKREDLSIIITSATLQRKELSSIMNCPVIECKGKSYNIDIHYLSQYENYYYETLNTIERLLLAQDAKTILVFFTALHQLQSAKKYILGIASGVEVLLLYGKQESDEQEIVMKASSGLRIILATNFAESSLTIPNVSHVIDCGREKVTKADDSNFFDTKTGFISKASAIQRKGRTGREMAGHCFRMYTIEEYERMNNFKLPHIQSKNLEIILLKFFRKNISILDLPLIHRPSQDTINANIDSMLDNKGIIRKNNSYEITKIGILMSQLDIDPQLSMMIYLSRGCLEIITLACVLRACEILFNTKD